MKTVTMLKPKSGYGPKAGPIRSLLLTKRSGFRAYAGAFMRRALRRCAIHVIAGEAAALETLRLAKFHFVIIDMDLLGMGGGAHLEQWGDRVDRMEKTEFLFIGPAVPDLKLRFTNYNNVWFLEYDLPKDVVASLVKCLRE